MKATSLTSYTTLTKIIVVDPPPTAGGTNHVINFLQNFDPHLLKKFS